MSFFSRARRRLLRRPPKSPPATASAGGPDLSPPSSLSSSTLPSTTPPTSAETAAPNPSDQTQDPDREPEQEQVDEEEADNEDGEGEDGDDSSDGGSSGSSDGEDATPTTPSNPPATSSDTDVDITASGTPPATNSLFPAPVILSSTKSRAWLSPDPAALKPQLFLDLSKMVPFSSPSGRPFGATSSTSSKPAVYTFGAETEPRETSLRSTGLGLLYGHKYTLDTVTLKIGKDEIPFQIHKAILTSSSPIFSKMLNGPFMESTQSEIRLDEDDPDAFGIIIEWLYTGNMAMFNPVWINKSIQISRPGGRAGDDVIHVPLPSYFGTPTASHESAPLGFTGPYQAMYQHICTQSQYASLSPEEIRLVEHFPANKDVIMDYVAFLQGREGKDDQDRSSAKDQAQFMVSTQQRSAGAEDKVQRVLDYLETVERIPVPVPFPTYIEAEYLQLVLIKVLITADKYCWEDLFNDAMDAFRVGEQHLGRRHPVVRHIELAYTFCPRKSPLVTLMADMAFYAGKAYQSQGELVEVGAQYPEFLEDLMARHDKQVQIPGYDPIKDALKLFRGPLSKAGGTYHYHPTKDSLAGPCPPRCAKRQRERAIAQNVLTSSS